jgi:CheY-like chemotaxis protein
MGVFRARAVDAALAQSFITPTRDHVALVRLTAAVAFCVGVLILLGWACDITLLKSGLPGQRATQPLSAVCFALCAISLGLSTERGALCRFFTRACALIVAGVVIATVWQNALDVDWGLDQLLFSDNVVHEQTGPFLRPGRPAAGTLVALALLSLCLLLIRARSDAARTLFIWLATTAALMAATVVLAYAFSLSAVYAMGFYAHVGLNSGIELTLLSSGVLLRRPHLGWIRVLSGTTTGASSARRMLLWTGSLLLVLAAIVRLGQSAAYYGAGFEMTLLIVAGFGAFLAALLSHARRIDSLDAIRRNVATDLQAAETRLERAVHERKTQLATLAQELRNPLTPLRNGVEIVRQMSGANLMLARTADMMARQIMQIIRLADELVDIRPSPPIEPPGTAAASVGTARLKILVADDNADGADSLAMLLQAQGHMALTASDGRRAVELAEVFQPDVILMDVAMPHMDGMEATREIRSRPWGARVRIVAVTAWGQESERRRTLEAGMDFHLVKPVDPQTLSALLRQGKR